MPAGKTYIRIASSTLTSNSASVTFSNIPQNYTDLIAVSNGAGDGSQDVVWRANGDTGSNYSATRMSGTGTVANSNRWTNSTGAQWGWHNTGQAVNILHLFNYSNSTTFKSSLGRANTAEAAVRVYAGLWRSTAAITSLTFTNLDGQNFASGITFTIYGIEAEKTPKATGGDTTYSDGTYWYHVFTGSGTFATTTALTADVLTVAGGGGGGSYRGGGGGAGGLVYSASQSLNGGYVILVGAGGVGGRGNVGFANGYAGTKGGNSRFGSLTEAIGGGRGPSATGNAHNGEGQGIGNGGSGCGVASAGQSPGLGTSGQGNNGGVGFAGYSGKYGAGGGGGAGAAGGAGTSTAGGAGGVGLQYFGRFYAGGGGGGNAFGGTVAAGGQGGGGNSGSNSDGVAGSMSTGGGGGGAGATNDTTTNNGGAGGSGIVIVRYAV